MKAWLIHLEDDFCSTIVFAESRGKAKSIALTTDCCCDADYTDIRATRFPWADKEYKQGKREMYWDDPKDRRFLVSKAGFRCEYVERENCEVCSAKDVCEEYQSNFGNNNY